MRISINKMKRGYAYLEAIIILFALIFAMAIVIFVVSFGIKIYQKKSASTQPSNQPVQQPTPNYIAPAISIRDRKPDINPIDPNTISNTNGGYVIDMDGDGINDFMFLNETGNLTYSKGKVDGTFEKPIIILTIDGPLIAYNIQILPNRTKPSILFWDRNKNGYLQHCLQIDKDGIPYFGEVEAQ